MLSVKKINEYASKIFEYKYDINDYLPVGKSKIAEFYRDKTIFLTGGTGFMGKVLIEKLLRTCSGVKKIYVIARPKENKNPRERLEELVEMPCFQGLKQLDPNFREKIILLNCDLREPMLGMSQEDIEMIKKDVDIVIHGAATVRFDQDLKTAAHINVRGTRDLLEIAKEMKNLQAFMHISTAYSNCPNLVVQERFYDSPMTADQLLTYVDLFKTEDIVKMHDAVISPWPNTYTFTKCIAENLIERESKNLPLVMIRPSIIIGSLREPIPGWIDNIYGPTAPLMGGSLGIIRTAIGNQNAATDLIPVDYTVNEVLVATYDRAQQRANAKDSFTPIYNCCASPNQKITCGEVIKHIKDAALYLPTPKMVWFPMYAMRSSYVYNVEAFLYHTIPAYIIDFVAKIIGKETKAVQTYARIDNALRKLGYFLCQEWTFQNKNTLALWDKLDENEKVNFYFSTENFDYKRFFFVYVWGVRCYLMKETLDTIEEGKKRFYLVKYTYWAMLTLFTYIFYCLIKFVFNMIF